MKYYITKHNGIEIFQVKVEGEPLIIPEYPQFQLAYRRIFPDSAYDMSFTVDEITTGYQVGDIYITIDQAINDIRNRILKQGGIDRILGMIEMNKKYIEAELIER